MMKKIIAVILCVCIFPIVTVDTFAAESELSDAAKEAYDVLSALGYISSDYTEDMIAEMKDFTRAEFAQMTYNVFGSERSSKAIYYHDVPATHFAAGAIAALVDMGILSVNEDKMFYPDTPITRTEAAKILLFSIGYREMCDLYGGWPVGIEKMASNIKLYKNVSSGQNLTYSDMLVMFYNAITSEMLEVSGAKSGGLVYEGKGGTYLSIYHDIYLGKGFVTGIDGVSIYGDKIRTGKIRIDDMDLELNGVNADDFLGREVVYLYSYDGSDGTLIWLKAKNMDDDVLILNKYDNQPEFTNSGQTLVYYTKNGSRKTVRVSNSLNLIFNGSYVTTGINAILNSDFYEIRLLKSGKNGSEYDIAIINDYENYRVASIPDEKTIWLECCDKSLPNRSILIDDYEKITISTPDGTALSLSEISFDSIVSVFESKDKDVIKIVVSAGSISGSIDSIYEEDGYTVYTINGTEYKTYKNGLGLNCKVGNKFTFLLDMNGRIAASSDGGKQSNLAYLIKATYKSSRDELYITMYTKSAGVKKYAVTGKIRIDDIKYKNMEDAYLALGGSVLTPGVVAYELNSEGNIIMLDLPASALEATSKTKDNMLVKIEDGSKGYDNRNMRLGQKTIMNSNTVIFGVPGNTNTAEDIEYSAGSPSGLEFEKTYTYSSYSYTLDKDFFYSDAVVINENFNVATWVSTYFAVDKISVGLNEYEEVVTVAEGYHGSTRKTVILRDSCVPNPSNLHPGDVISIGTRVGEEVVKYTVKYCPHTDPHTHTDSNKGYGTGGAYAFVGRIYDIKDNVVKISYDDDPSSWQQMISLQNTKILIHDSDTKGFREGNKAEILTFKAAGNKCDKVLVYIVNSELRNFIIYRQ